MGNVGPLRGLRRRRLPAVRTRLRFHWCLPIAASALLSCGGETAAPARDIAFTDVGRESGIDFEHHNGFAGDYYYFETFGSGAAFIDYDGDGWLDIYLVDGAVLSGDDIEPTPVNKLYRSDGGQRFVDVSASVGAADAGYGMGCAIADYDNDGDQDLFVANYGADAFFRNDDGSFLDVTDESGLGDSRCSSSDHAIAMPWARASSLQPMGSFRCASSRAAAVTCRRAIRDSTLGSDRLKWSTSPSSGLMAPRLNSLL